MRIVSGLKWYRDRFGPLWFRIVHYGTVPLVVLYIGSEVWLTEKLGWPESYGFYCHGRGCIIPNLTESWRLLQGGSIYELTLFCLFWALAVFAIFWILYPIVMISYWIVKDRLRRHRAGPRE